MNYGYEESNYNRDAVRKINENGGTALLLDRIDVRIGKSHTNVFELADIFVERDGEYFLIHVKRQHADDLSHHCEQLQRSAHYLSTQFAKRGAGQLLVRAALNGFYLKYDLSIVGLNGKRPTHTSRFTAQLREQGPLLTKIMRVIHSEYCDERMRAIFEEILSRHDLKIFSESEKSILATFDAIFDIVGYKDIIGDNETFYKDVKTVLNQMFMALKAQRDLFSKGVMGKDERRKVTLVLAVIDDRKVYKVSKAYREKARLLGSLKKDLLDRESLLETKRVKLAEQKRKHAKEVALLSSKATKREKKNAKGRKQTCEKRIIKLSKEISQADANLGRERQQKQQRITVLEQELKALEDAIDPNDIYTPERAFHDQNLWKLDETRMLIQKQEFGFKLMVINEGKGEEYDALGPLSDANGLELPLTQRLPLSPYDGDDSFEGESVEGNQDDKGLDDLFADDVVDEGAVVDMEVTVPPVSVEASPMSIMDSRKRKRILTQQEEKAAFGEERKKQKTSENVERSEELDQQFVLELQAMREKWPLRFLKLLRQGEGSAEITGI